MAAISATFAAGDTLRVVARSNGQVEIYKNTTLLGTRDASAWTYSAQGGYIGLWSLNGPNTLFDDFGGGTYAGASGPARADDPQPAAKALRRIAAQHPAALPPVVVDLGRVAERAAQAVADIQARAHTWGLRSAAAEPEPKSAAALFAPIQREALVVTPVSPIAGEVFRLYVSAGARPVAVRSIAAGGATSVQYLHPDHLGSIGQITDANRNWVQDVYFKPYGGVRWAQSGILGPDSDSATRRSYTGQYEETSQLLGSLMHYKARYYSPFLHRFTQPDTIVPGAGNPQNLNRYLYTNGNPTTLNDPTGHCPWCIGAAIGAVVGAVIVGGVYALNNQADFDWGELAVAAGTGAVAGGLIGSGVGAIQGAQLAGTALAGAAGTAAATAINAGAGAGGAALAYTALSGSDYNSGDAIINTVGGAATGAVSGVIPYGPLANNLLRTGAYAGLSTAQYAASTSLVHGDALTWEGAGGAAAGGAVGGVIDSAFGNAASSLIRPTRPMSVATGTQLVDPKLWATANQAINRRAVFFGGVGLMSGTAGSTAGTDLTKWMESK